ncbi:hypothetical protein [Arenimonas sp. MALMAid1274]|uniref:hypothetical protein n=1 Tax=Arenimonas sp. MALMAid1274 TaxID=3411630 RepID=UPI003BA3DA4B
MPYQLFDPSQACNALLPLNPVQNKLSFYKVLVFEVSLSEVADAAELPISFDRHAPSGGVGSARFRLGLPIVKLFPELQVKYQEVRTPAVPGKRLSVQMSTEGSFLPLDPARPRAPLLDEHIVSAADVAKGRVKIGKQTLKLDPRDQLRLAGQSSALVKLGARTVRITLAPDPPPVVKTRKAKAITLSSSGPRVSPSDLVGYAPAEFPDAVYEDVVMALLADRRNANPAFEASVDMARVVASLPDHIYRGVVKSFSADPRFAALMLRLRRRPAGLQHSRPKLPRYDIGLFTSFEQTWTLQGYSRGSLLNSLTLAPEEEMTIEVFTFDRRKVEEEKTQGSEFERNTELSVMASVTSTIARELSESSQVSGDIGLGLPLPAGGVPVNIDVGASASSEVKADIQASLDQVSEVTSRVSERVKSTRQVKVVESRETGREDRVTRKLRNANQGHALTLNCYEVLETFQVETQLKDVKQFCLLVEPPDLGAIDIPFVLAYQDRLQRALLSKTYQSGFDAARSLYAQGWFDHASIQKAELEEAAQQSVAATPAPTPQKPVVVVARQLRDALVKIFDADLLEAAGVLAEYYNPFDGKDVSERDRAAAESALGLFNYAFKLKTVSPGAEDRARVFIDAMREDDSEAAVVAALGALLAGTDDEWMTNLKMIAASLVSAQLASLLLIPFPVLVPVFISLAVIENNAGYPGLCGKAKQELKAYETAASVVPPGADASTSADLKTREPPPQLFSLQDLAMARADFDALRLHLEANRTYYMNQVWSSEDPNARYERFRAMGIDAYVENRLVGFVGARAIHPLRLSALDPLVRRTLLDKLTAFDPVASETVGSGASARTLGPIQTAAQTVSLPTSAVFMDGGLGQCELLEPYLKQRREIERRIAQADADLAELRVQDARNRLAATTPAPLPAPAPTPLPAPGP